ncbi:MAG: IS66 family transposase [Bacillales bacterium]|nr:IS66 family transposase [Bacillales bacterium]
MKTNEELIKELEEAKKYIKKLEREKEEALVKLYETNKKLDEALLKISVYQEKYNIARTKQFIPSIEKLESIVVNEVEETLKKQKENKKTNKGKKYNKPIFDYEKYVTETRYIYPEEKVCPECGKELKEISSKIRYVVEVIPSKIKVIKLIKVSMKCPECNKRNNKIYYPLCNENLIGSILTPSLAAFIAYHKYELGIPLEHLAKHITNSIGFDINKENLSNYMAKVGTILEPIYEKMKEDLLNNKSKVIHSDETTLVVTKRDEANKDRKKSYVYVYTSSYYDEKQIRIYDFHESRSIDETTKWLKNYDGVVECDNYSGYDKLKLNNSNIMLQKCWAHVRRRYADILKNLNEKQKKESKAYLILKEIGKLFDLEKQYRKDKLTPSQIVEARKKNVPPIKEKLYELVYNSNPAKNSALEKAIEYTKDCWDDLYTFVDNGYVEMTNNTAERAVKPFVIQRKVFQTSGSYAGARYTGKIFSIIQTCLINNVNVEKYLEYVLNNLNRKPIEELLPYSKEIRKMK